ncbi:unnamed protein product (macronuclear) [Paramecium tetraurelia]|uniref:riboflavin kinase n=1 Tax=Paramecium tetraurelia TaxID=5888 RepID=A0DNQ5_PARTE|nr:uncharacterized protein GSPATT00018868001 [Paramecium tetraurelia]CAK84672.1 unnamed protein product [Paramecium tetraurelia]|eukprot:XP_001452069.1 hypothetical protein (macronuclear) [Paramecium tetraurelia strain d4-2]
MISKCYINCEIILDFNSLLFSILKKQNPDLNLSLNDVQENPKKYLETQELLLQNLSILKPQIGVIETLQFLESQHIQPIIYSEFAQLLQQHFPYLNWQEFTDSDQNAIFIDPRIDFCEQLLKKNLNVVLFKNHKLKDKDYWNQLLQNKPILFAESWETFPWQSFKLVTQPIFSADQYKVNESENASTKYWNTFIKLNPIEFTSKIIHGRNRGGTMLGIPTANLQINEEIQQLTKNLLPGVYAGITYLENKQYGGVLSIGYNPYFLDTPQTIEVHLYGEFQEDFYGANLRLIITHFLRPESDFRTFDHLIKAISNDKIIARKLVC